MKLRAIAFLWLLTLPLLLLLGFSLFGLVGLVEYLREGFRGEVAMTWRTLRTGK